jgi:hypothetical protein
MSLLVSQQDVHGWVTAAIQAIREQLGPIPKLPNNVVIKGLVSVAGVEIKATFILGTGDSPAANQGTSQGPEKGI